jgi:hypothetical protein
VIFLLLAAAAVGVDGCGRARLRRQGQRWRARGLPFARRQGLPGVATAGGGSGGGGFGYVIWIMARGAMEWWISVGGGWQRDRAAATKIHGREVVVLRLGQAFLAGSSRPSASWACVAAPLMAADLHRPGWRRKMDRSS